MKTLLALIFIFFSTVTFSQYDDYRFNSFFEFYTNNYLNTESSGRGFTGLAFENDISGLIINPATVTLNKKYQLNFQYTFKGRQPWLENMGFNDIGLKHQLFSASAGFGWKVNKNFQTGFVYSNPQGMYFDLGEIIRTDEFGNELGRYDGYENISKHSFSIPLIINAGSLTSAVNLNYIYARFSTPGVLFTTIEYPNGNSNVDDFTGHTNIFKTDIGLMYKLSQFLTAGISVSTGMITNNTYKLPDGSRETTHSTIPWKGGTGFSYLIPNSQWKIGFDYIYNRTSAIRNLKDRHDFHLGTEGPVNKNVIFRAGFFTMLDNRIDNGSVDWFDKPGDYDQYFITLGGSYINKDTKYNLALMTSQISPGKIKNLIINGGVTFNF